jgi:hypothetical protein
VLDGEHRAVRNVNTFTGNLDLKVIAALDAVSKTAKLGRKFGMAIGPVYVAISNGKRIVGAPKSAGGR